MDQSLAQIIIAGGGTLLGASASVIAWFIKRDLKRIDDTLDRMDDRMERALNGHERHNSRLAVLENRSESHEAKLDVLWRERST